MVTPLGGLRKDPQERQGATPLPSLQALGEVGFEGQSVLLIASAQKEPSLKRAVGIDSDGVYDCYRRCLGQLSRKGGGPLYVLSENSRLLKDAVGELRGRIDELRKAGGVDSDGELPFGELAFCVQNFLTEEGGITRTKVGLLEYTLMKSNETGLKVGKEGTWEDQGSPAHVPPEQRFTNDNNRKARQRIVQMAIGMTVITLATDDSELRQRLVNTIFPSGTIEVVIRPPEPGSRTVQLRRDMLADIESTFRPKQQ